MSSTLPKYHLNFALISVVFVTSLASDNAQNDYHHHSLANDSLVIPCNETYQSPRGQMLNFYMIVNNTEVIKLLKFYDRVEELNTDGKYVLNVTTYEITIYDVTALDHGHYKCRIIGDNIVDGKFQSDDFQHFVTVCGKHLDEKRFC